MIDRRRFLRDSVVLGATLLVAKRVGIDAIAPAFASTPFRAFSDSSEWNLPLPVNAPVDPMSDAFIQTLKSYNSTIQYPKLAASAWAEPVFWAKDGDPEYSIAGFAMPVRIPLNAVPAATSDAQLTVYDLGRGCVIKLQKASFDGANWTSRWTSIYYLGSNGLAGDVAGSDDVRNHGHRGTPPAIHAVRFDEVQAGAIEHVLKVAIRQTAPAHVYPLCGDEGGGGTIPEGAILRIKPSVDLSARGLSGAALTVARAMQTYGVVVGDQAGQPMVLKLEALPAEGLPQRWSDVSLSAKSLSRVSFDDLECIQLGYQRA